MQKQLLDFTLSMYKGILTFIYSWEQQFSQVPIGKEAYK